MSLYPQQSQGWPPADPAIFEALRAAWDSGDWGRYEGQWQAKLAADLARFHHVPHVLTCCSGTVAVEIALRAVGVRAGQEVILAAYDFPGNFRAIEAIGARPVLVDVDPSSWSLAVGCLEEAFSENTSAILVSHLHGALADMPELCRMAQSRGVQVVEDACQATGAIISGRRAGTWGDAGVLSFGGSKLLTAGRGGAVLTADPGVYQRAKLHVERGNHVYPLSELQAAVLVPQLQQLTTRNSIRWLNVQRLRAMLADVDELHPGAPVPAGSEPAFYKVGWRFRPRAGLQITRADLIAEAHRRGLPIDSGFRGFTRRSDRRCRHVGALSASREAVDETLVLHHPILLEPEDSIARFASAMRDSVKTLYGTSGHAVSR